MANIQVSDSRMYALVSLFDLHTRLFLRALENIKDGDAHKRLDTKANHIAWLAGSLVQQRHEMANGMGIDKKQAAHELFKDYKGIQDEVKYPSLDSYKKDWEAISPQLRIALCNADDNKLKQEIDMGDQKISFYDLSSFLIYREASMIGQIALWRRLLGYEAMKYD